MPGYDYKCKKCGKVCEINHKIGAMQMKHCPSCGGELARVYNAVGVVFKGAGFHSTDYKKSESKKDSGSKASKS